MNKKITFYFDNDCNYTITDCSDKQIQNIIKNVFEYKWVGIGSAEDETIISRVSTDNIRYFLVRDDTPLSKIGFQWLEFFKNTVNIFLIVGIAMCSVKFFNWLLN